MKCPKCKESMKTNVEEEKYECEECGNEVEWRRENDNY